MSLNVTKTLRKGPEVIRAPPALRVVPSALTMSEREVLDGVEVLAQVQLALCLRAQNLGAGTKTHAIVALSSTPDVPALRFLTRDEVDQQVEALCGPAATPAHARVRVRRGRAALVPACLAMMLYPALGEEDARPSEHELDIVCGDEFVPDVAVTGQFTLAVAEQLSEFHPDRLVIVGDACVCSKCSRPLPCEVHGQMGYTINGCVPLTNDEPSDDFMEPGRFNCAPKVALVPWHDVWLYVDCERQIRILSVTGHPEQSDEWLWSPENRDEDHPVWTADVVAAVPDPRPSEPLE